MLSCLWDGAYKRTFAANRKYFSHVVTAGFLSLSKWSFTLWSTPYNFKQNVLGVSLNRIFPFISKILFVPTY